MNATGCARSARLSTALCLRYASVHVKVVRLLIRDAGRERVIAWQWAFGMFSEGKCQVLGIWPDCDSSPNQIFKALQARGVVRIRLVCFDNALEMSNSDLGGESALAPPLLNDLRVDGCVTSAAIEAEFIGRRRRALRSAAAAAEQLNVSLVRAARRDEPFASVRTAEAFLAQWLEQADRRLFAVLPPVLRRAGMAKTLAPTLAMPGSSAG